MNITVIVRTLNEEKNVNRFCASYQWADQILMADGGSEDETISVASQWENVQVRAFTEMNEFDGGIKANPRGRHVNFLIDWAKDKDADIIIFDDVDCVPTKSLQANGRAFLEPLLDRDAMMFAYRMFIYGQDKWFPQMTPRQSLWAWSSEIDVKADEESYTLSMKIPDAYRMKVEYPYALLHYFYPDEKTLAKKKRQYVATGEVLPDYAPLQQFGKLEDLPAWAVWK